MTQSQTATPRPRALVRSAGTLGLLILLTVPPVAALPDDEQVGLKPDGALVPTRQLIRPAGESLEFAGRPVDLAIAPDGRTVYAKDNRGVVVMDADDWSIRQELAFPQGGGSMHGIAVSADGRRLYATSAQNQMHEAEVAPDGRLSWLRAISLPGPDGKGDSHACGIALTGDGATAYVALSRNNTVGIVDLAAGSLTREIPVGVAPFDLVLADAERTVFVSNWGGRHPEADEKSAPSSGTPVLIDDRGIARSGTVGKVDLHKGVMVVEVATGLHPSDLIYHAATDRLYVANANSDTVTVLDTAAFREIESIAVRPDPALPFGSAPNGLALTDDGRTLYVANGGNNALCVVALAGADAEEASRVRGFIPTAWYPGAIATGADGRVYVANVKGFGSRARKPDAAETDGWSVYQHLGVVTRLDPPDADALAEMTGEVLANGRVPQMLRSLEARQSDVPPRPVPERLGDPSVFEHVVYIIKENRTYDQVLGDLPQGNGDPSLCIYGREVTPNHHALAEEFVLLDNFYCNGVNSADGHAWVTEGNVTDHLEKSFGGFTRSYTFGDDPLTYSSSGFLWDNVLLHGLSFRNYGEMDYAETVPDDATFSQIYEDFRTGAGKIGFTRKIGIETLGRFSCPDFPGWNMRIPDVLRAEAFLKEFREAEKTGEWPSLIMIYLPQDHTSGTSPGLPTPEAHMADNDLAVGRIVEAISASRFWPKSCVFVIEDDPQNGFDHVDGHRSVALVASPYTKRGEVVSEFYNQTSVLHTMERMLGCPPMNQMDAMSPLMSACFTKTPDLTPYEARPANIDLDELNRPISQLNAEERHWAELSLEQDFETVDGAEDDTLNRILWHASRGTDAPYPAELAGAHGRGLKDRNLIHVEVEDDDDE